jgi:ABC-type sugar transport system ATPase subunit
VPRSQRGQSKLVRRPATEGLEPRIYMNGQVLAWHLDQFRCRVDEQLILANATLEIQILGKLTAIVGPNGGGKSTLVKLFTGHLDNSRFRFEGAAYLETINGRGQTCLMQMQKGVSARRVSRLGVEYVSQEPSIPSYANWQDVFLAGREGSLWLPPRPSQAMKELQGLANSVGLEFQSQRPTGDWARADLQRFAILRALSRLPEGGLLIFDEATASLSDSECAILLAKLRDRVRASKMSMVFISHRSVEISLADQIIEVRHGRVFESEHGEKAALDPRRSAAEGETALDLRLSNGRSITLRRGEVGVLPLASAAEENALLDALAGQRNGMVSQLLLFGVDHKTSSIRYRRRAGLRLIPGNRTKQGIFGDLTALENVAVGGTSSRELLVNWSAASEQAIRFSLSANQMAADARHLSGGFKQRVLFARELDSPGAKVLVAFNALQGLDAVTVPKLIADLHAFAAAGGSVLLVGAK